MMSETRFCQVISSETVGQAKTVVPLSHTYVRVDRLPTACLCTLTSTFNREESP